MLSLLIIHFYSATDSIAQDLDHEHGSIEDHEESTLNEVALKLRDLDRQVLTLITRREEAQQTLNELTKALKLHRRELKTLQSEVTTQYKAISRAFILRKKLKGARIAELLLSANGPLELKRRELNLQALLKAGSYHLIQLTKSQLKLQDKERSLSRQEEAIQQIKLDLSLQVDQLLRLRSEEARLLNPQLSSEAPQEGISKLPPPTLGLWEDRFQSYRGRQLAKLYGHGIKIMGTSGAPVYSVEAGTVVYVGWLRNRGTTVMISHPQIMDLKEVFTIYLGLKPCVHIGQKVHRQTLIGELNTERNDGGLFFELRQGRAPIYPRRYFEEIPLREGEQ